MKETKSLIHLLLLEYTQTTWKHASKGTWNHFYQTQSLVPQISNDVPLTPESQNLPIVISNISKEEVLLQVIFASLSAISDSHNANKQIDDKFSAYSNVWENYVNKKYLNLHNTTQPLVLLLENHV